MSDWLDWIPIIRRRRAFRDAVDREARALIARFGDRAYDAACLIARAVEAKHLIDEHPDHYWTEVRYRTADLMGIEIGLDTATRMLRDSR